MKPERFLQLTILTIFFCTATLPGTNAPLLAAEMDSSSHCNGVTLEDGAAILDLSIDDLLKSSSEIMVSPDDIKKKTYKTPPVSCSIKSKSNFFKFITYVTYIHSSADKAGTEFNKMQKGFESITTVDKITDIGDKAFWVSDTRFQRLVAIKGDVIIDVLSPKDFELQKRVTQLILDSF